MKHKRFNEIFPYTYYIQHIPSKIKYYGVRWRNLTLGKAPNEDLGISYFTSITSKEFQWFKDCFQSNQNEFKIRIHYTFDTIEEARDYEYALVQKVYFKSDWANRSAGKAINNSMKSPEERKEMSRKLSEAMRGKNTGPRPEWVKEKLKRTHRALKKEAHPRWGISLDEDTKRKIADSLKEYFANNPNARRSGKDNPMYGVGDNYIATSPEGEIFKISEGFCIFCRERNIDPSSARRCALGKQKTAKGWRFCIIKDQE